MVTSPEMLEIIHECRELVAEGILRLVITDDCCLAFVKPAFIRDEIDVSSLIDDLPDEIIASQQPSEVRAAIDRAVALH